jgi:hypothetical protein
MLRRLLKTRRRRRCSGASGPFLCMGENCSLAAKRGCRGRRNEVAPCRRGYAVKLTSALGKEPLDNFYDRDRAGSPPKSARRRRVLCGLTLRAAGALQ